MLPSVQASPPRLVLIDAIKAVACQLIVLHHLAFYGPMSDAAFGLAPNLISWFSQYARVAVQAFLVVGGFLAARGLAPDGLWRGPRALSRIGQRYARLVLPFATVLVFGMVCAAIARQGLDHYSLPGLPTLAQFAAHLLLLQNVLDIDALSAGAWYVAIDFQLFVLLVGLLWLARRAHPRMQRTAGVVFVGTVWLASLFVFNRDADLDSWPIYFFGAYALGVLSHWAAHTRRPKAWLALLWLVTALALWLEWRLRIAVALSVAMLLGLAASEDWLSRWPRDRVTAFLGRIAYSVFLVHFPICLLVNMLVTQVSAADPWINLAGMVLAWGASIGAGALFYRWVEQPAMRLRSARLPGRVASWN